MSDATGPTHTKSSAGATIRESETAHFGKLAPAWWDPKGSSAMLHKLNPVRLAFIRAAIDRHWGGAPESLNPLAGMTALDAGCGAGLLCEPLARLGAQVTGVDAAPENVAAAKAHAEGAGLLHQPNAVRPELFEGPHFSSRATPEEKHGASTSSARTGIGWVRYLQGELTSMLPGTFDLVASMEVLEHVADKRAFVAALAARLAPGGLMVLSTPNRTARSRLLLVGAAEAIGMVPKGTHDWDDFVTPDELRELLAEAGLTMGAPQGIAFSLTKGLHLSADLALNYIVTAVRSG